MLLHQQALTAALGVSHGRGALEMGSLGLGSRCRLRTKAGGRSFLAGLSMSLDRCEHPPCVGQCPQTRPPLGPMTTPLCPEQSLVPARHRQGCCPRHVLLRFSCLGPRPPWPSHLSKGTLLPDSWQPRRDLSVVETLSTYALLPKTESFL